MNRLQSGFQGWVTGQDKVDAVRLEMAHGADHQKSIPLLFDIQIGYQHVKIAGIDLDQVLRHAYSDPHLKAMLLQDGWQHHPDAVLVIYIPNASVQNYARFHGWLLC